MLALPVRITQFLQMPPRSDHLGVDQHLTLAVMTNSIAVAQGRNSGLTAPRRSALLMAGEASLELCTLVDWGASAEEQDFWRVSNVVHHHSGKRRDATLICLDVHKVWPTCY